ncbi:adenylyltransferase/cytidyltransferase family protein [Micromonospora sp. CPCC 205539]|uniref:adenylyltransferase/cytidyltransferase family protein n=1 Tax=Micromonospora sp. CPCC 205539 TaxID=3122408 RepID=UPI002FF22014
MLAQRQFGLVLGRFQPVHLGHVEYLRAAKQRCTRLVIGITNPDLHELGVTTDDPARGASRNNPFTYHQRAMMVEAACLDDGWASGDHLIVPAPINQLDRLTQYLPPPDQATFFVTIYDEWGESKKRRLEGLGYPVETLWRRTMEERLTSGTEIRTALRAGSSEWRRYVPARVAPLLESYARDI